MKAAILLCVAIMISVVYVRFRFPNHFVRFIEFKSPLQNTQARQKVSKLPRNRSAHSKEWAKDRSNLTVVTAFFNLGTFIKGTAPRSPDVYFRWLKIFSKIQNPVIGYTDDLRFLEDFKKQRNLGLMSSLTLINRSDLYSFSLEPKIDQVFRQIGYPRHQPNTVLAAYSCAMHAKYELVAKSVAENIFNTYYFMWLDIGLFREINVTKQKPFKMVAPMKFRQRKHFMMGKAADFRANYSVKEIVFENLFGPAGGSILATIETWPLLWEQYKRTIHCMLHQNLMSTDQQTILAMFTTQLKSCVRPAVQLQISGTGWFQLGYEMRKEI